MPGTAATQPNYADSGQTGSAYPTAIDAITQAMARIATAFNPHAVPAAAAAPVLTASAGGALGARTYYSKITLVTPAGEVTPSAESNLALNANTLLNVASPTFALGVTGWNVYVSTASGTETKQNASPIALGTNWIEPTGGLISGAALPAGLSKMAVIVDAGVIPKIAALPTEVAAQITSAITAPATNPRNDIVYIDQTTGVVGVATGTEAASPTDPAVPAGKSATARIRCTVGMTAVANSQLDDLRNPSLLGVSRLLGEIDAMVFKGVINCSTNPNYPAADAGHMYRVSVAGKIGGASGPGVEVGDILTCITDGTTAGDHATVGPGWTIIQVSLDGTVVAFAAYLSAGQSIDDNVVTKVTFNAELFDTNSNFDSTTNYRFTPTVSGYYQINFAAAFSPSTDGDLYSLRIHKNGSLYLRCGEQASIANFIGDSISQVIYFNGTTDYIEFYAYQDNAANTARTLSGASTDTMVSGIRIGGS